MCGHPSAVKTALLERALGSILSQNGYSPSPPGVLPLPSVPGGKKEKKLGFFLLSERQTQEREISWLESQGPCLRSSLCSPRVCLRVLWNPESTCSREAAACFREVLFLCLPGTLNSLRASSALPAIAACSWPGRAPLVWGVQVSECTLASLGLCPTCLVIICPRSYLRYLKQLVVRQLQLSDAV